MADFTGYQYRIRAGAPMNFGGGSFVWQTFMAEKRQVDIYLTLEEGSLKSNSDFKGQGGYLESASYQRLNDRSGKKYRGTEIHSPTYIDEDF